MFIRSLLAALALGLATAVPSMKISSHPAFPLAIHAKASGLEKGHFVQLRYQRASGKGPLVATSWLAATSESIDVQAMRVAGGTQYKFEMCVMSSFFGTRAH